MKHSIKNGKSEDIHIQVTMKSWRRNKNLEGTVLTVIMLLNKDFKKKH